MATLLTILKFAGLVVSSVLGILGIVTKTHDEVRVESEAFQGSSRVERRMNRWGKFSLTFMLAGAVVALTAQVGEEIEKSRAKEEAARATREQLNRAQVTLQGVERLLFRINDVSVTAFFHLPVSDSAISADLVWLGKLPDVTPDRGGDVPGFQGVVPGSLDETGQKIVEALVYCDSPFHPYQNGKTPLKDFLQLLSLSVTVYKATSPSDPTDTASAKDTSVFVERKPGANIAWQSRTVPVCSRFQVHVDRSGAGTMVNAPLLKPAEYADGRVTSLRDLPGCEIVIYPILSTWRMPAQSADVVNRLITATEVSPVGLLLEIDGVTFDLSRFAHRKVNVGFGAGGYCYRLPPTFQELIDASKHSFRPTL